MLLIKDQEYLSTEEASSLSDESRQTLLQEYKSRGWTKYKYGKRIYFSKAQIQSFIERKFQKSDIEPDT